MLQACKGGVVSEKLVAENGIITGYAGHPQKVRRKRGKQTMKKVIAMAAVVLALVCSIGMGVSAAAQDACHHNVGTNTITYGTQKTNTYTHPVLVAYKPNGDPILAECTVTETYQPMRVICSGCGHIISDWEERIGISHSIKH